MVTHNVNARVLVVAVCSTVWDKIPISAHLLNQYVKNSSPLIFMTDVENRVKKSSEFLQGSC